MYLFLQLGEIRNVNYFCLRGGLFFHASWGESWSFDKVLPFYLRSENNTGFGKSPWHGQDGPLQVVFRVSVRASMQA